MTRMNSQSLIRQGEPLQSRQGVLPVPKDGEVLVRVSCCGLCHSDLHLLDGYFDLGEGKRLDLSRERQLPFTFGHEICGTIESHGPSVMGIAKSERLYAVYPWIGCGACDRCRKGDEHLCDEPRYLGVAHDGGFSSHVLVPHPRYLIDADGIDPAIAGSYMCSGLTAFSALKKTAAAAAGGPLLIMGLGGVGLMALQLARTMMRRPIVAADIDATKRNAAMEMGADLVLDPEAGEAGKLLRSSMGHMAAAIDFVGSSTSLDFAQSAVGKGGAVVVVGLMGGRISLPVPLFALRQLSILGSFVGSLAEARELMALIRLKSVKPIPVSVRPLAEINAAILALREGRVLGRIALRP
jgi:D-arabinose 1-dehydrogenase-like Zn-dependent alcohol dehydrogenase